MLYFRYICILSAFLLYFCVLPQCRKRGSVLTYKTLLKLLIFFKENLVFCTTKWLSYSAGPLWIWCYPFFLFSQLSRVVCIHLGAVDRPVFFFSLKFLLGQVKILSKFVLLKTLIYQRHAGNISCTNTGYAGMPAIRVSEFQHILFEKWGRFPNALCWP